MRAEGNREGRMGSAERPSGSSVLDCLEPARIDFVPRRGGLSDLEGPLDPLDHEGHEGHEGLGGLSDPSIHAGGHAGGHAEDRVEDPFEDPSEGPWPS